MVDQPETDALKTTAEQGVILKAENGDVIGYDQTGLVLRLSDKVIADIADRLTQASPADQGTNTSPDDAAIDVEALLDGVDAWDVREEGDWVSFMARRPGLQEVRRYRKHCDGGAIIADGPGPFYGIFCLGGQGASLGTQGESQFPCHILTPDDDIGAVGQAGEGEVVETARLMPLREQTHEALVAEVLLKDQLAAFGVLPLFMVRAETDGAPSAARLADGVALGNLITSIGNFARAAQSLGKVPKIKAICLDFVLEDVLSDAQAYRDAMLSIMRRIEQEVAVLGFQQPLFIMRAETPQHAAQNSNAAEGQWELSWNNGDHQLLISAPGYMFAHTALDRPTDDGRRAMAEMTAAALQAPESWTCPVPHLAELNGDTLKVTFQAAGPLVIDPADPFDAGDAAGFTLEGVENEVQLLSVEVDKTDKQAILMTFDDAPHGADLILSFACGATPRSAVRDGWSKPSVVDELTLHRWALPARLPVWCPPS